MDTKSIEILIGFGFAPSDALKRSTWNKVTRVMDFLVNKGIIARAKGSIKYRKQDGSQVTPTDITSMARIYLQSPIMEHMDEFKKLSKTHGVPMNSGRMISLITNL